MKFFQIIPADTNIDFIGKFKIFFAFSIMALIGILVGINTKGLNYGVDFTGGTVLQVEFKAVQTAEQVRTLLIGLGEPDASVVSVGTKGLEFMITSINAEDNVKASKTMPLVQKLTEKVGAANITVHSVDVVGPKVGKELKSAAILSLFYSIILITIYIWLRFDIRFAPGATIAMVHDLTMATGFYLISGQEFTITAIAALLTIAGYSVNDTIVIYDRVREIMKGGGADGIPMEKTINKAINLTLSRTILTSGVTLLSILPIIIFCKGEIQNFAYAMVFGLFVGTYSTVYIASPFTIYVEKYLESRSNKPKGTSKGTPRPATA